MDDKGELYEQGFRFSATTKFLAITEILARKFKWSTLLRQIVKDISMRIYEQYPVENPRASFSGDILQKVEAGEKGYGYYTQMEIWMIVDDLKG